MVLTKYIGPKKQSIISRTRLIIFVFQLDFYMRILECFELVYNILTCFFFFFFVRS